MYLHMRTAPADTIDRTLVAEQVYEHLRRSILRGEMPQGSRIVEVHIAKSLGTSRAPVREAVNRLIQDGLLETRAHYGASVIKMTAEKAQKLYEIRVAIECVAIREVVRRRTSLSLVPLRRRIAEMKQRALANDLFGLVEAEMGFHEALWSMAGNPYLEKVAHMIGDQVRMALVLDNAGYANLNDVATEHEPLVDAIEAGDEGTAVQMLADHIMHSLTAITVAQTPALESGNGA